MRIAWFSCGVTSAVATKLALDLYNDIEIYYIGIKSAHSDNARFTKECEAWFGQEVKTIINKAGYKDQYEVIEKTGYINGPFGARCTLELKKNARYELQNEVDYKNQIFGFEFSTKEINRAIRFKQQHPITKPLFPLIDAKLNKEECHGLMLKTGIEPPTMYKLGYSNNNCIGCVKEKKGYWNKIREDFPKHFDRMAKLERKLGSTCIKEDIDIPILNKKGQEVKSKKVYLDELTPGEGISNPIVPDCGMFCQLDFEDLMDANTAKIMSGELNMKNI